jgi:hypothetical protein
MSSISFKLYSFEPQWNSDLPMYPNQGKRAYQSIPLPVPGLNLAGAKELVTLTADLSPLPTDQMPQGKGADGQMYFICRYEIRTKFHSAHTTYSLWYDNKCYGAVNAEYA